MPEYIEREAAKKVLAFGVGVTAANALDNVPAADVAPVVHGRWEKIGYDFRCSACGVYQCGYYTGMTNYCPNCGARMDGEGLCMA